MDAPHQDQLETAKIMSVTPIDNKHKTAIVGLETKTILI